MYSFGLDIGTTSICLICVDSDSGKIIESISRDNAFIDGRKYEKIQSPEVIFTKCKTMLDDFFAKYSPVCSIGITGQMHGVVYLDENAQAISPLYTWQDMTGNEICEKDKTYAQVLTEITGYAASAGFGLTTVFAHGKKGEIPVNARKICTIHDYTAMKLCGNSAPVMHTSDAASFGVFDPGTLNFDKEAVKKAGINPELLPEVISDAQIPGKYKNTPVTVAIGDNQASFMGSVSDTDNSILVNIGTGSQISFKTDKLDSIDETETRPYNKADFIRAGSALCGGRAFAGLEKFIRDTANLCGADIGKAYSFIDAFLDSSVYPEDPVVFDTRFQGTRADTSVKGSISGLTLDNFTPAHLIYGVLDGITDELLNMYKKCGDSEKEYVVGSGNGLRKNKALQKIIEKKFDKKLLIPAHCEEAAFGAVLYSLTACGKFKTLEEAQKLIKYI